MIVPNRFKESGLQMQAPTHSAPRPDFDVTDFKDAAIKVSAI